MLPDDDRVAEAIFREELSIRAGPGELRMPHLFLSLQCRLTSFLTAAIVRASSFVAHDDVCLLWRDA